MPRSDGFTMPFARTFSRNEYDSEHVQLFLRDVADHVLCTNIATEDRFSRARRHIYSAHGNSPSPATVAADHMLSEWKAHWTTAKARWANLVSCDIE